MRTLPTWLFVLGLLGCATTPGNTAPYDSDTGSAPGDAQAADAAAGPDVGADLAAAGGADGQATDAAVAAGDATLGDGTGTKATAWGPIGGVCADFPSLLAASGPAFAANTWHFDKAGPFDPAPLRAGAKERYTGPNAGGSSKCSEVMSMQLLNECGGAVTLKTETQIIYDKQGTITDWLASFGGTKVGVSVTRAYLGPKVQTYTAADATTLLKKKLTGANEATANVSAADKWARQIVHIWTLHADWVPILQTAWLGFDAATRANTIVLVTVEEGSTDITADTCQ